MLVNELTYAYENVPFYKKHFDTAGIKPADIKSARDIANIPTSQKRDFRKNFPMGVLAKGFSLDSPILTRSQSSGTTGERLVTYEMGLLLMGRAMASCEVNPGVEAAFVNRNRKICRYAAPNCSDVECANPNSTMSDRLLSDGTLVLPVYHDLLTTSERLIETAIEEILEYQPDLYYVDPTHFAFLMGEFKKRGIRPPKAPILCSYTSVTELNKARILSSFDDDAVFAELLSCSEMGWVAMDCPAGHLHLNDQSYFIEVLDPNGNPVSHGGTGELVISSIDQGAIPHIRYKTGDYLTVNNTPCDCGHQSTVVEMSGRGSNSIHLQDGSMLGTKVIDRIIGAPSGLELYQLHQHTELQFTLRLINDVNFDKQAFSITTDTLHTLLGESVDIQIEYVNYISTERSGKFQILKSDIDG